MSRLAWPLHATDSVQQRKSVQVFGKLDFLVRFWELKGRHASDGEPLSASEQVELLSLLHLVHSELRAPEPGPLRFDGTGFGAELVTEAGTHKVMVRAVSAASIGVVGTSDLPASGSLCFRVVDAVAGVEYTIPCRILFRHGTQQLALAVDGVPLRATFGSQGAWFYFECFAATF